MSTVRPSRTGPIPIWLDPERAGWPFQDAATVLSQSELSRRIKVESRYRPEENGHVMPRASDYPKPDTRTEWWSGNDIHTPILLEQLLRGEAIAFGDPDRSGGHPEWITSRQWKDLARASEAPWCFGGGGRTYWNVRVLTADEFQQLSQVAADVDDLSPAKTPPSRHPGGRPISDQIYAFYGEVIRLANLPDGIPDDLRRRMTDWMGHRYGDESVSEATIGNWLKKAGLP